MSRLLICSLLLVPVLGLAHQPHPVGAPAHPEGSPDYHPIETTISTTEADDSVLRALLLQIVELLQLKLALLLGSAEPALDPDELIACTADAMQCPDGSYVGRTGPNCEFICPSENTSGRTVEVDTDYVTIYTEDGYRYFESKAIPDHDTGSFPNPGNPNTISEQSLEYKVTLNPQYTGNQTPAQLPGIALNGIPMEPGTAEREGDYNIEALQDTYNLGLDENNAHVQPTGLYHYHGVPEGFLDVVATDETLVHVGYAADGFMMYHDHSGTYTSGWELIDTRSDGTTADGTFTQDFTFADSGTLDECNGAWLDDDTYAYFLTDEFPYIPRCLNGTPDASFAKGPGAAGLGGPAGGVPPRP